MRFGELARRGRSARASSTSSSAPAGPAASGSSSIPDVAKIAFTGSTEVGALDRGGRRRDDQAGDAGARRQVTERDLRRRRPRAGRRARLGSVFDNAGQDCCARSRIFVQESALDRVHGAAGGGCQSIRVGDPLDEQTEMGPLISAGQRETVASFVARRRAGRDSAAAPRTARATGSRRRCCARSTPDDRAAREEIFGPVACVIPFKDEERGGRAGQRHDLRALRLDLDPRRRPRAAGRAGDRRRRAVDQLQQLGPRHHAVRRLQAIRLWTRARAARARRLHRNQDRSTTRRA